MKVSFVLRIICLVAVAISGILFFQIKGHRKQLEDNLIQSRIALQKQLEESASFKSRVIEAEESNKEMVELAKKAEVKSTEFQEQSAELDHKINDVENARIQTEQEVTKLGATNRDLQREITALKASIPSQNWREQQNQLQSRLVQLEAENTSLKQSLASVGLSPQLVNPPAKPPANYSAALSKPVGKVMRMGPDGSFAILSYGRQMGAAEGQTLTIQRENQKIALVSLTQITNDFSIAQILSSTNTGSSLSVPDIRVGDPAYLE